VVQRILRHSGRVTRFLLLAHPDSRNCQPAAAPGLMANGSECAGESAQSRQTTGSLSSWESFQDERVEFDEQTMSSFCFKCFALLTLHKRS
jgi:hypothetical protein